jgi:bacillopeptidase F (M6 metalloprotease family)
MSITRDMWEMLNEGDLRQQQVAKGEQFRQTKFVGQAMSEIKSDPRWKLYADHVQALKEEAEHSATEQGKLALSMVDTNGTEQHKREYLIYKTKSDTYQHVLELLEALIERGETASEQLKGVAYAESQ